MPGDAQHAEAEQGPRAGGHPERAGRGAAEARGAGTDADHLAGGPGRDRVAAVGRRRGGGADGRSGGSDPERVRVDGREGGRDGDVAVHHDMICIH